MIPSTSSTVETVFQQPLSFEPVYQERIWGGRRIGECFGRTLPAGALIGESWEIVDRPEAQSFVRQGAPSGTSLHTLWSDHRSTIFGEHVRSAPAFPLLVKMLDARETLPVQVHPSGKESGPALGEPKNEWWYILDAEPEAAIYSGFRKGVGIKDVEAGMQRGTLENILHRIPVKKGDALFVPGGRCHAIGGGCLIAEIQQNSDTTFRMFDWNRVDASGAPRALHAREALACVNAADYEPELDPPLTGKPFQSEFFSVKFFELSQPSVLSGAGGAIFLVLSGRVTVGEASFRKGDWFILPVPAAKLHFLPEPSPATLLQVHLP